MIEQVREATTIHLDKDGKPITGKTTKIKSFKPGPVKEEKEPVKETSEEPDGTN